MWVRCRRFVRPALIAHVETCLHVLTPHCAHTTFHLICMAISHGSVTHPEHSVVALMRCESAISEAFLTVNWNDQHCIFKSEALVGLTFHLLCLLALSRTQLVINDIFSRHLVALSVSDLFITGSIADPVAPGAEFIPDLERGV